MKQQHGKLGAMSTKLVLIDVVESWPWRRAIDLSNENDMGDWRQLNRLGYTQPYGHCWKARENKGLFICGLQKPHGHTAKSPVISFAGTIHSPSRAGPASYPLKWVSSHPKRPLSTHYNGQTTFDLPYDHGKSLFPHLYY